MWKNWNLVTKLPFLTFSVRSKQKTCAYLKPKNWYKPNLRLTIHERKIDMEFLCEIIDPWKCQKWSERFVKSKNFGEVIFEMDFCPQMYSNVLFMECYNPAGIQSLFWSESLKNTLLSTNMYILPIFGTAVSRKFSVRTMPPLFFLTPVRVRLMLKSR